MAQVVFLRGVNVGGHKTFQPSVLAKQMEEYGVVNVGAAGTFVVHKPISQAKLRAELLRRLPFQSDIMICSGRDITNIASANLFDDQPSGPDIVRFVSVLAKRPRVFPSLPLNLPSDSDWILRIITIQERFVFGLYRRQMRAISYLSQIDKHLGERATTRNWNTIHAIVNVLKRSRENS